MSYFISYEISYEIKLKQQKVLAWTSIMISVNILNYTHKKLNITLKLCDTDYMANLLITPVN